MTDERWPAIPQRLQEPDEPPAATYRYRFTIRPPDIYTCPPGWIAMYPLVPARQWNYGEVVYPEPLPMDREAAEHGKRDIEKPGDAACRKAGQLARQQKRRGNNG